MIGRSFSHFRILEHLGTGGMGEVYLAEDVRLGRPVALKMLPACRREEDEERHRLLAEARMVSALNHPGIAVVYEVDEVRGDDGAIGFLAMEYVPGLPIDEWARRERPDLDRRLVAAAEVAEALAHAHAQGIVHRDVKPSNVLVSNAGRVKVLDFGVAVRRDPAATATATTVTSLVAVDARVGGTLGYMAPEQAMGYDVDARADAFAFGVVLYELLAGEAPFRGSTSWELVGAVLHREAPPLVVAGGDPRGPALARLVERLLSKEPAARPADLASVAGELRRLAERTSGATTTPALSAPATGLVVTGFEILSGESADDWIGAGLRETVASDLERLAAIEVVPRDRTEEARRRLASGGGGREQADALLGRALGARFVVGGAVQRVEETVRVTSRLLDLAPGGVAETFKLDGRLGEIFALQDRVVAELARRVAAARGVAPVDRGAPPAPEEETTVVAAYEALSRGLLNQRTETAEGVQRAILLFERAVALDPRYARAHLELGVALGAQGDYLVSDELKERALAAISVARRLRPGWLRAERETGAMLVALGRDEEGIEILERALAAAPEEPTLLGSLARAQFLGRADFAAAAALFERSLAANPLAGWYWLQLAHLRTLLAEYAPARAAAERAIELQEKSLSGREGTQIVGAYMRLGHALYRQGHPREAVEALQRELAFIAHADHALRGRIAIELHLRLGLAFRALDRANDAASHLSAGLEAWQRRLALGADDPFTRYYAAQIHAQLGDDERALAALERAAALRPRFVVERARREPELASLAGHPRFRALLDRAHAGRGVAD
jgi:tetratricopeptide (TPR) repeat protein/predicted Ser/Thr protein kinase